MTTARTAGSSPHRKMACMSSRARFKSMELAASCRSRVIRAILFCTSQSTVELCAFTLSPSGELLAGPRDQASRGDHVGHEGWNGLRLESLAVHLDLARVGVYPDLHSRLGRGCHVRVGYYRQAEVEAVAVEDASKALANNAHYLRSLHRVWDVPARGARPEILTDDEDRRPVELIAQ